MATLYPTGEHEAIHLTNVHTQEILYLEKTIGRIKAENGGFGKFLIEIKYGLTALIECSTSQLFNRRKH